MAWPVVNGGRQYEGAHTGSPVSEPAIMMDVQGGSGQHGRTTGQAQDKEQVQTRYGEEGLRSQRAATELGGFVPWFLISIS